MVGRDMAKIMSWTATLLCLTDSSTIYQKLTLNITNEVDSVYKILYSFTYVRSMINQFTSGPFIVNMTLFFINQTVVPNATSAEEGLINALSKGNISLNIDTTSIYA
ncbi:hypothetical protein DPEC_G00187640, partial [Dallia pectoralis]